MQPLIRRRSVIAAGAALLGAGAFAQAAFPSGPIRLVVPFAPGGSADLSARLLAELLRKDLGVAVIVDNRAGAAGVIGTQALARAPADGHHLLLGTLNSQICAPLASEKPPYDGVTDFVPLGLMFSYTGVLLTNAAVPASTFAEFVAYAKQRPGRLNYGSAGIGSNNHLLIELIKARTGMDLVHVPYRGTSDGQQALASGDVSLLVDSVLSARNWLQQGKARPLAVTSEGPLAALPGIPSLVELRVLDRATPFWLGLFGPRGLPAPIVTRLREAAARAVATPEVAEFAAKGGGEPGRLSAERFAHFLLDEQRIWGDVIRQRNIKVS